MLRDYKPTLEDLKYYDTQIYSSMKMISETDLSNDEITSLQLNFTVDLFDSKGKLI